MYLIVMANNLHKKLTHEDRFARKCYCQHARLNSVRSDKRNQKRLYRSISKKIIKDETENTSKEGLTIKIERRGLR